MNRDNACYPLVHQGLRGSATPMLQLEVQHNPQRRVESAHLFTTEITHTVAEPTGVDRRGLFSQDACEPPADLDLGPKGRGPG